VLQNCNILLLQKVHCGCDYIATDSDNCVQKTAAKTETVSFKGKSGVGKFCDIGNDGGGLGWGGGGREGDVNLLKLWPSFVNKSSQQKFHWRTAKYAAREVDIESLT